MTPMEDPATMPPSQVPSEHEHDNSPASASNEKSKEATPKRGLAFWLVFLALAVAQFLAALDSLAVSTALPTIVNNLNGKDFVWVGSAYTLAATAFLPWTGSLATIFGRKPIMIGSLVIFGAGSAVCGAAQSMEMLIAGRTLQGLGSGGIMSLTEIIISDLVALRERGMFFGIIGAVWAIASAIGPPVGGALAQNASWRWLFYLNLPLTGVALVLVLLFLKLKIPTQTFREKMARMDWIGNILIIGGCSAAILGLSWGGSSYPWGSYQTLVPLIVGVVGLVVAFLYEFYYAVEPTIPFSIISNRTSISGYLGTFFHSALITVLGFYLPVYFQGTQDTSPVESSVAMFATAFTVAPAAIITGILVSIFNRYRPQNWFGWVFFIAGMGAFSSLQADSEKAKWIAFQVIAAIGFGMLFPATNFAVLAPINPSESAHALAFFTFVRTFAQTWGVTIGSAILQNELSRRLPAEVNFGGELAYAAIPVIPTLPEPLKSEVHDAFAKSLQLLWQVMTGIGGLGLLSSLIMKEIPLATNTDEAWGFEEKPQSKDEEKGVVSPTAASV